MEREGFKRPRRSRNPPMARLTRAATDRNPPTLGGGGCQAPGMPAAVQPDAPCGIQGNTMHGGRPKMYVRTGGMCEAVSLAAAPVIGGKPRLGHGFKNRCPRQPTGLLGGVDPLPQFRRKRYPPGLLRGRVRAGFAPGPRTAAAPFSRFVSHQQSPRSQNQAVSIRRCPVCKRAR